MSIQIRGLLRILFFVALGASLILNVAQLYWLLDSGITVGYSSVTMDELISQRDIAIAICNSSLSGGSREEIIATAKDAGGDPFEKQGIDGVIVDSLVLVFDKESLTRIELTD